MLFVTVEKKEEGRMKKDPSKGKQKDKPAARDPKTGRFLPGNKTGGRRELPADVKEMLAAATPGAVKTLVAITNDENARHADRIRAAEIILNRVYGLPKQSVDLDAKNIPQVVFVGGDCLPD